MSDFKPTKEAADQAMNFMATEVHVPSFFQKLASLGIEPQNDTEAGQLLEMGERLAAAESSGTVKISGDTNPFITHALGVLDEKQAEYNNQPAVVEQQIKQSSLEVATENEVARNAALIFNHVMGGGELVEA